MEEVTDRVFRRIISEAGGPDVWFTEFISARHLLRGDREALRRLDRGSGERPIVAQIWGNDPEDYRRAAKIVVDAGFDGIDINMGCPQPKITKKGACSALILNPKLAAQLIHALKDGIREAGSSIPVSVKTRIGFSEVQTDLWCGHLLDQGIAALTIHGRTAAQMSEGHADWTQVAKAVLIRNHKGVPTKIVGNGDLVNLRQLETYAPRYGVDGLMVGRGIFENPFLFRSPGPDGRPQQFHELSRAEHLSWARKHLDQYKQWYGPKRNFEIMKKFFKVYLQGFEGADEIRERIMEIHSYEDAEAILLSSIGGFFSS